MKFDVGQRVLTSEGEAIVLGGSRTPGAVRTSRGLFPAELVSAWVDVDALRKDPELLEAWLDGSLEPEVAVDDPWKDVEAVEEPCACDCGRAGRCNHLLHVVRDQTIFRSPHLQISTDCRCVSKGCPCLI